MKKKPSEFWTWFIGFLIGLVLLFPLILLAKEGLTLTGMTEESTGYRYFYTLRILYGEHERPWLPQGQLVGLVHMGIQLLLTTLGYPPTQLYPRIDLFTYLAAGLPHLVTVGAFIWAVRPISTITEKLILAATFIVISFQTRSGGGISLVQPDYMSWAGSVSLLTIGWVLRLTRDSQKFRLINIFWLGLFGGACLAIKPTYIVFPLTVGILLLLRAKTFLQRLMLVVGGSVLALVVLVALTLMYYLGDGAATFKHFELTYIFTQSQLDNAEPFLKLLKQSILQNLPDALTLSFFMPIVLFLSFLLLLHRQVSFSLLFGSILSSYVAYKRFYPVTFVETNYYLFVAVFIWYKEVVFSEDSVFFAFFKESQKKVYNSFKMAILTLLYILMVSQINSFHDVFIPPFSASDAGSKELDRFMKKTPGITLFLIPNNNYRPTTIDSAIYKGGMDIISNKWGDSPFVKAMFPDRWYILGDVPNFQRPLDISPYDKLVFVSLPGQRNAALQQLNEVFGVTTVDFDCSFEADLRHHLIVGCTRQRTERSPQP